MAEEKRQFPTEVIDLPSKGWFYPEDNPLSNGQVEIKYMTAKEEDILTSANLIRQGVVVEKLGLDGRRGQGRLRDFPRVRSHDPGRREGALTRRREEGRHRRRAGHGGRRRGRGDEGKAEKKDPRPETGQGARTIASAPASALWCAFARVKPDHNPES